MKIARLFTEHPESVGESYRQHMGQAGQFGICLLTAGLACLLHSLLPFCFENTGSNAVRKLHTQMSERRRRAMEGASVKGPAEAIER